jgi:hypothetical protein
MNRLLQRIIALLLVSCLAADASMAGLAVQTATASNGSRVMSQESLGTVFDEQALAARLLSSERPSFRGKTWQSLSRLLRRFGEQILSEPKQGEPARPVHQPSNPLERRLDRRFPSISFRGINALSDEHKRIIRDVLDAVNPEYLDRVQQIRFVPWYRAWYLFLGVGGFAIPKFGTMTVTVFPLLGLTRRVFLHELGHLLFHEEDSEAILEHSWGRAKDRPGLRVLGFIELAVAGFIAVGFLSGLVTLFIPANDPWFWPVLGLFFMVSVALSGKLGNGWLRTLENLWRREGWVSYPTKSEAVLNGYAATSPEETLAEESVHALRPGANESDEIVRRVQERIGPLPDVKRTVFSITFTKAVLISAGIHLLAAGILMGYSPFIVWGGGSFLLRLGILAAITWALLYRKDRQRRLVVSPARPSPARAARRQGFYSLVRIVTFVQTLIGLWTVLVMLLNPMALPKIGEQMTVNAKDAVHAVFSPRTENTQAAIPKNLPPGWDFLSSEAAQIAEVLPHPKPSQSAASSPARTYHIRFVHTDSSSAHGQRPDTRTLTEVPDKIKATLRKDLDGDVEWTIEGWVQRDKVERTWRHSLLHKLGMAFNKQDYEIDFLVPSGVGDKAYFYLPRIRGTKKVDSRAFVVVSGRSPEPVLINVGSIYDALAPVSAYTLNMAAEYHVYPVAPGPFQIYIPVTHPKHKDFVLEWIKVQSGEGMVTGGLKPRRTWKPLNSHGVPLSNVTVSFYYDHQTSEVGEVELKGEAKAESRTIQTLPRRFQPIASLLSSAVVEEVVHLLVGYPVREWAAQLRRQWRNLFHGVADLYEAPVERQGWSLMSGLPVTALMAALWWGLLGACIAGQGPAHALGMILLSTLAAATTARLASDLGWLRDPAHEWRLGCNLVSASA